MTRGAFAYVGSSLAQNSDRADGLRSNVSVIDLKDPAQPKLRGSIDFPDMRGPNGMDLTGDVVFAAGGKTVQAIGVSNPDAPSELARFTSVEAFPGGADDAHDLVFRDGHLFITAQTTHALVILKVSDALQPALSDTQAAGHKWVDRGTAEKTTAQTFRSETIKGDVSYVIYLPSSYDREKDQRYPVVYWLHGGRGSQRDCGKFVEVTDKAIRDGKCPEMIIVGVNGLGGNNDFPGSQYSDWKDGSLPMESVIIKDLLPHIDKTYRTLGTREGRGLEGFSMGGHGALHLAFRHPDLFGVVTAIGPALIMPGDGGKRVQWVYEKGAYKGDKEYWLAHDPLTVIEKNAVKIRGKMFIRLITGEVEGNFTHRRTVELSEKLKALKIDHDFVRPGETGHNYVKVYEAMPKGYQFYAKAFGQLTPKTKEPPSPRERPGDTPPVKEADPEPAAGRLAPSGTTMWSWPRSISARNLSKYPW
jgi:endo-1,4-beta-xylanase